MIKKKGVLELRAEGYFDEVDKYVEKTLSFIKENNREFYDDLYDDNIFHHLKVKIFELPDGAVFRMDNHIANCHECGKVFSPNSIILQTTDRLHYHELDSDVYCRVCIILDQISEVCEHLKANRYINMYDRRDRLQGAVADLGDEND